MWEEEGARERVVSCEGIVETFKYAEMREDLAESRLKIQDRKSSSQR